MKYQMVSRKFYQILLIGALAVPLFLEGCAPASASVAEAGAAGSGYQASSQVDAFAFRQRHKPRKPLALSNGIFLSGGNSSTGQIDPLALRLHHRRSKRTLALSGDGTSLGWNDNSSGQMDISATLAAGRTRRHGRKLT